MASRQRENSLEAAYRSAADILKAADPESICLRTGVSYYQGCYYVRFLNSEYEIEMADISFTDHSVILIIQVMILHYLTSSGNTQSHGEFINFQQIEGGMFYYHSFQSKALDKLAAYFTGREDEFIPKAEKIGGTRWKGEGYSVRIPVFPKVDLIFQFYPGDEEFPSDGNILFSDIIENFLPVEDIAFLSGYLVNLLGRAGM